MPSRHVHPVQGAHAPAVWSAWVRVQNTDAAGSTVSLGIANLDRIPRDGRVPIDKQSWPSPSAVLLRDGETAAAVGALLSRILRVECLAVHDDLLRWMAHFTDRPLLRNERSKIAPF